MSFDVGFILDVFSSDFKQPSFTKQSHTFYIYTQRCCNVQKYDADMYISLQRVVYDLYFQACAEDAFSVCRKRKSPSLAENLR